MPLPEWKEPSLAWNGTGPEAGRGRILEIRSDAFLPEFLAGMATDDPGAYFEAHQRGVTHNPAAPLKLYQPLHGCFYLITASLVCRQLGLPDKAIDRAGGQNVFFVIRRRTDTGEEAWVEDGDGGAWLPLQADGVLSVQPGEERLPLHTVQVCPKPETPHSAFTDFVERQIHYGYIPTGYYKKYKDAVVQLAPAETSPETLVNDFIDAAEADVNAGVDAGAQFSFRYMTYRRRVHEPWMQLLALGNSNWDSATPTTREEQWLYALLELGDYLKHYLPTLWAAVEANDASGLVGKANLKRIFDRLGASSMSVKRDGATVTVSVALRGLAAYFDMVRGQGEVPEASYENDNVHTDDLAHILESVQAGVKEEDAPIQLPGGDDSELVRLVKAQAAPQPTTQPRYQIRAVYEYDPECPCVVSELPSWPFTFAKVFEPDAPARMLRLETPSIKPQDLRRYAHGVGIEMSPELQKLTRCLSDGDVQGVIDSVKGCNDGGISLQMICTFSIQIIFLVAFIVMFIFLIILNFIFWWLAYLRICLPIPRKE